MDYAKESLKMHYELKGKIEVVSRAKVDSKDALSLAYTPGVAQPCLEIQKDINKSYELTRRWNTVAVVTDGTAVLGLGDIGPEAVSYTHLDVYKRQVYYNQESRIRIHLLHSVWKRTLPDSAAAGRKQCC